MKKTVLLATMLAVVSCAFSQLNGDPKYQVVQVNDSDKPTGLEISDQTRELMDRTPLLTLSEASANTPLAYVVDITESAHFPDIFNQEGGCCAQASGIAYTFAYEINRVRNIEYLDEDSTTWYPTHFTYNFLNEGSASNGSNWIDGWNIVKTQGCPTAQDWGGMAGDPSRWMTGYDKYDRAMGNRIKNYYKIDLSTEDGLMLLKHWLNDHNEGSSKGGTAVFGTNYARDMILALNNETGQIFFTDISNIPSDHAMTIVGYDDTFVVDYNGDGNYTNPVGNMTEWEIGALKIANSWSSSWPSEFPNDATGCFYLPYRYLAKEVKPGADNPFYIDQQEAYVINVKEEYTPKLILKVNATHECRESMYNKSWRNHDNTLNEPESDVFSFTQYFAFNNIQSGCLPMQGINYDPIEYYLDMTPLVENDYAKKIFHKIGNVLESVDGEIISCSFIDQDGVDVEIPGPTRVTIEDLDDVPYLTFEYDYIPSEITAELTIDQNFTINKHVYVKDGATLRFENNCTIQFVNGGKITVEAGGKLEIEGGSEIIGVERQANYINIDGNINIEPGARISNLTYNGRGRMYINNQKDITFDQVTFEKSDLQASLNFHDITIINSTFDESAVRLSLNSNYLTGTCRIENNVIKNINHPGATEALKIESFNMFEIRNNTFRNNHCHGIGLYYTGRNDLPLHAISGNYIFNNINSGSAQGIRLFNSVANIYDNTIYSNDIGIGLYHDCVARIYGVEESIDNDVFQKIHNNTYCQLFAGDNSYPVELVWNIIQDGGDSHPLIEYVNIDEFGIFEFDVSNNCWDSGFDPENDLIPFNCFVGYGEDDDWDCSTIPGGLIFPEPKQQYDAAIKNLETGNYTDAETQLKNLIITWPESNMAEASIKTLPAIEVATGTDFSNTINFLNSNVEIQSLDNLKKLAGYTTANCNIYRKNYAEALGFYESVIANPPTYVDYVYAVIDAGRVALKMEEEGKASYTFKYPELIPADQVSYEKNRNYLLSTIKPIGGDGSTESETDLESMLGVSGESFDCANGFAIYPNPFTQQTTVSYYINTTTSVEIKLYNATGALVKVVENGIQTSGEHTITIDGSELSQGVYYIAMQQEGQKPVVEKLVLLK